jgi:iron complex outermembrane receptor protein
MFRGGSLDGFGLGGGVRYIGSSFGSDQNVTPDNGLPFKVPAVSLFDAAVHYDWRNYRFAINAQNLFDTEHVSACWNFNNGCFYGARRTVVLSARYRW